MKYTLNQKCEKTGTLLVGLREPEIAKHLRRRGFTGEVLKEGWGLFNAVVRARLRRTPARTRDKVLLNIVDQFEKEWFAIVQLTLTRHYPVIGVELRPNLIRSEGKAVVWSVSFFLERLTEMNDPEGMFGADGPAARALLEERGLTDEVIAPVADALDQLDSFAAPVPVASTETSAADLKAAEDAMWAWYVEWSGMARRDIDDGNILRALGLGKRRSARTIDASDEGEEIVVDGQVVQPLAALPAPDLHEVAAE